MHVCVYVYVCMYMSMMTHTRREDCVGVCLTAAVVSMHVLGCESLATHHGMISRADVVAAPLSWSCVGCVWWEH